MTNWMANFSFLAQLLHFLVQVAPPEREKLTEFCSNFNLKCTRLIKDYKTVIKLCPQYLHFKIFHSGASASTSARSSRSSTLGSGFSTRSATTSESDAEVEALDNVRVVARLVILFRSKFTYGVYLC